MSFNEILLIPNKSQINPDFLNTSLRLTCVVTKIDNSYLVCRMFMNISPDPFQSFRTCPANSGFRCWPVKKLIRPVRSSPTFTVQITYSSDLKFSACNHEFAKVFFFFFFITRAIFSNSGPKQFWKQNTISCSQNLYDTNHTPSLFGNLYQNHNCYNTAAKKHWQQQKKHWLFSPHKTIHFQSCFLVFYTKEGRTASSLRCMLVIFILVVCNLKILTSLKSYHFWSLFWFDLGLLTFHENSNHGRETYWCFVWKCKKRISVQSCLKSSYSQR